MTRKKILIAGGTQSQALESSYRTAAEKLGYEVLHFDIFSKTREYIKLGKFGEKLHLFLPIDAWNRKMNRELIIATRSFQPDVLYYFASAPIFYGSLATIKIILPKIKIVWVWPDTPMNLAAHNIHSAKLVDLTASYSSATIDIFNKLGFENVNWVPLGGDENMHGRDAPKEENFSCDISFVGGWRPERELVMKAIAENFPQQNIEIHGPYWKRNCKHPGLKKYLKGDGFFGRDLGVFFNQSRININQIDDTNFPAANMRFFEVPTAGGLELCSACPEMEQEFIHKKHLVYFKNIDDMLVQLQWILDNPTNAQQIRNAGQELLLAKHTYSARIESIMQLIDDRKPANLFG